MKNNFLKSIIFVLLLILCFHSVNATSTTMDVKCNDNPAGPIKICWKEDREYLGQVTTDSCTYEYTTQEVVEKYDKSQKDKAIVKCEEINSQKPACCYNQDPKYPMCAGEAICGKQQKCRVECIKNYVITWDAGEGKFTDGTKIKYTKKMEGESLTSSDIPGKLDVSNFRIRFNGWSPSLPLRVTGNVKLTAQWGFPHNYVNQEAAMNDNDFYSTHSKTYSVAQIPSLDDDCAAYKVTYPKWVRGKLINCGSTTNDSSAVSYKIDPELDDVYCLQPGKAGPGKACRDYEESDSFDITECKNQFLTNIESRVECGLAQILYQTVEKNSEDRYVSNKKYNNGSITLALRLWMAKYAGGVQPGLGINPDKPVTDDPEISWVTKDNYYAETVKAIDEIKSYSNKEDLIKQYDEIVKNPKHSKAIKCCIKGEGQNCNAVSKNDCGIYDAIILFKEAENVNEKDYLGGEEFINEIPKINVSPKPTSEAYSSEYKIGLPEVIQRKVVEKDCTTENHKNCIVQVKMIDSNGNELDPDKVDVEWYCKKEYCEIKLTYKMLCEEIESKQKYGQDYIEIYLRNWYENSGWIRFYKDKYSPDKYQQMISFAFNKKYCEDKLINTGSEVSFKYPVTLECPCGDDKCNDLTKTKKLSVNCNNGKDKDVNVDPDMNCIINACKPSDKLAFDETVNLGADVNICHIYCKEDVDFYLAPKTKVYTGMRFSYDIRPNLVDEGKVNSSFKVEQKLTSIVLQKKLCTSEIDYKLWKKTFDEINDLISKEKNTALIDIYKKSLDQWIYNLQNCNLYSSKDIKTPFNLVSDTTNVKELVISKISEDAKLELNYEDSIYGKERNMGKVVNNSAADTKYCTNTANAECYKYEKDKEVLLTGKNITTTITYCNGKNCNNKISVPTNDYASFEMVSEVGFYQPLKYYAEEYSGTAVLENEIEKDKTYISIPDYEYPIKITTPNGAYDVNYKFSNIGKLESYDYTCQYEVEKTTPISDQPCDNDKQDCSNLCPIVYKDGSIDLSNCSSSIIFRNVDLDNLFPNGRSHPNNWTNKEGTIDEIQSNSVEIFTNEEKYLDYRYTLTPEGIKQIKQYNKEQNQSGGYLNETLSCEVVGDTFINCKSDFLKEIKEDEKFTGVIVNKAGDEQ